MLSVLIHYLSGSITNVLGGSAGVLHHSIKLWVFNIAKINSITVETLNPDQPADWKTLYRYSAKVVHPRIIMSQYESQTAYILSQDMPDDNVPSEHIKVFRFDTDRDLKPEQKFRPEFYMTLDWIKSNGKKYGKYDIRLDRFYLKESGRKNITVYNFGDEISIAMDCDIREYTNPKLKGIYWQRTDQLPVGDDPTDGFTKTK